MTYIPQIQTPEEKKFYAAIQSPMTMEELDETIKWFKEDFAQKKEVKKHVSRVSDAARVLMLRELMYNPSFTHFLYNLGRSSEPCYKKVDSLVNLLLKDNKRLGAQMYKSLESTSCIRPRVFNGDTLTHIAGRMGYFNILNKIFLSKEGTLTLLTPNASGYTPIDAIGQQMDWLSAEKEKYPDIYTEHHNRLKGCKSTSNSHINLGAWKYPLEAKAQLKRALGQGVANLGTSILSNGVAIGVAVSAINGASLMYDKLADTDKGWIGYNPYAVNTQAPAKVSWIERAFDAIPAAPIMVCGAPAPKALGQLLNLHRQRIR